MKKFNFRETYLNESFFDDIEDDIFTDVVDNTLKLIDDMNKGFIVKSSYSNKITLFRFLKTEHTYDITPKTPTFIPYNTYNMDNMLAMFTTLRSIITLDLSGFDTSNVTDMACMFKDCKSLENVNLKSFDTSKVDNMQSMFMNCESLKELDLSTFNISNVINMHYLFYGCISLEKLDISNFSMSNVKYIDEMFKYCKSLKYIKCTLEFKDWCYQNLKNIGLILSRYKRIIWDIV